MAFHALTKYLRDGALTLLEDDTVGFNATMALAATAYGVTAFTLDFTGETGNFFQGRISERDLEDSTYLGGAQPVVACLYTQSAQDGTDRLRMLSPDFSGVITLAIDIYLMYREEFALVDFETLADAVTDAMFSVFSGRNVGFWPVRATRRWEMRSERERIEMAGTNWMQCIHFEIPFEVSI